MLEDANLLDNDGEGGGNRTIGTSIVVNGTAFATSLFWQPLQNPNDFMSEVEEASNDIIEGADLFAVKSGKAPQFGICVAQDGYKVGGNVAAIALMTSLSDFSSIVGVFEIDGGWWYVCSRNDVILSDGDMLYLDEEEAKSQLMSMLTVPDWDKKYAPASWNIPDTEVGDIEQIFDRGKRVKLQKIKALRGTKLILVVVAAVIIGGWLVSTLFDFLMAPPKRKVVAPTVRPKPVQMQQQVVIPKPWENFKNPTDFMTNCYKGVMNMVSLLPPGWNMTDNIVCSGETVATSWNRGVGLIAWAENTMRNSGLENLHYTFTDRANEISATLSLPKISTITSVPEKTFDDLIFELNKKFEEMGVVISLVKSRVAVDSYQPAAGGGPLLGGMRKPVMERKSIDYTVIAFKLSSEYNPLIWLPFLTKYSTIEVKHIEYRTNSKVWNYEGVFYVK